MVHDTPARKMAREMKRQASELEAQASTLEGIEAAEELAEIKASEARKLREKAEELAAVALLEDLTVRQSPLVKRNKKGGEKAYWRWVASWGSGKETKTVYLGSVSKMSQAEALEKARKMKSSYIKSVCV